MVLSVFQRNLINVDTRMFVALLNKVNNKLFFCGITTRQQISSKIRKCRTKK